jgi:hypothetical protein
MPADTEQDITCRNDAGSGPGPVREPCGVFPVESGGPVIGLGLIFLLAAIIPVILGIGPIAPPAVLLFGGFGIFLIWLGFAK